MKVCALITRAPFFERISLVSRCMALSTSALFWKIEILPDPAALPPMIGIPQNV